MTFVFAKVVVFSSIYKSCLIICIEIIVYVRQIIFAEMNNPNKIPIFVFILEITLLILKLRIDNE